MGKFNIFDFLFYLSMLVITVWLILKITGIVKSPLWFEIGLPVGGFVIAMITSYYNLSTNINKIARELSASINKVNQELSASINKVSTNLAVLNTKFEHLDKDVEFLKRKVI